MNKKSSVLAIVILAGFCIGPATAQEGPKWNLVGAEAGGGKLSRHLIDAVRAYADGRSTGDIAGNNRLLSFRDGQVEVDIRFDTLDEHTLHVLGSMGVEISGYSLEYGMVRGRCPLPLLTAVSALSDVASVHPEYGFATASGSSWTQADSTLRAPQARTEFSVDGTGVMVGILSDSFHDTIGGSLAGSSCSATLSASGPQLSGDLPTGVAILNNGPGLGTDEGAAMGEIIHDVAPGADLMFHAASGGIVDFANGVTALKNCGADVIVDDVLYFAEPMFQDGPIAQAVRAAANDGVAYFAAAGNLGRHGISETFNDANHNDDTTFPPSGKDFHRFVDGDTYASVTVPAGCGFKAILQWAEPFDGALGAGASSDYDLLRCTSENPESCFPMDGSAQGCSSPYGGGDPLEMGTYTNSTGSTETVYLAVDQYCGNDVPLRLVVVPECSAGFDTEADVFTGPQIYGHAAVDAITTVGAVFFGEVEDGGTWSGDPAVINAETYSSVGGNIITYFDDGGNVISPSATFKPELVAPEGGNTTFFGYDLGYDADTQPNFTGSSASVAHAAGVAALMLDLDDSLTPAILKGRMTVNAWDVDEPGIDNRTGFGLLDAMNTLGDAKLPVTLTSFDASLDGEVVILRWTTQHEADLAGYDIQHRRAGDLEFGSVGWLAGTGSDTGDYRFSVDDLEAGGHVFRLRTVDLDGSFAYSPEVEINVGVSLALEVSSIFPDPFTDSASFSLSVARRQHVEVGLFDITGRRVAVLHRGSVAADEALRLTVDGSDLPSGRYFVRAVGESTGAVRSATIVR